VRSKFGILPYCQMAGKYNFQRGIRFSELLVSVSTVLSTSPVYVTFWSARGSKSILTIEKLRFFFYYRIAMKNQNRSEESEFVLCTVRRNMITSQQSILFADKMLGGKNIFDCFYLFITTVWTYSMCRHRVLCESCPFYLQEIAACTWAQLQLQYYWQDQERYR
jgi:hypothetical protein